MFPHPKPLFCSLLTSLITASTLTPPPNDPHLPSLLLPATTNDTSTLPNTSVPDTWYPYYALSLPANPTAAPSSSSSSNHTLPPNPSSLTATAPRIVCNGTRYGRNLRVDSCFNAYRRMDDADVPKTYGQRDVAAPGHVPWDANLPLRILSSACPCNPSYSTHPGPLTPLQSQHPTNPFPPRRLPQPTPSAQSTSPPAPTPPRTP